METAGGERRGRLSPGPTGSESELWGLARAGSPEATEELLSRHLGLVRLVLGRLSVGAEEYDELQQAGRVGLLHAITNFDPERGTAFSTYAVPCILGEVRRERRERSAGALGRRGWELLSRVRRAAERLQAKEGREPTLEEVAREIGESVGEIILAQEAGRGPVSLNGEEAPSLPDPGPVPTEAVLLRETLRGLPTRLREVLFRRYYHDETQAQVAAALGVSQVQVHRLEQRALGELRKIWEA